MQSSKIILGLVVVVVVIVGFMATKSSNGSSESASADIPATVYKSPTCGCCGVYASYMDRKDYDVFVEDTNDLYSIKEDFGVPHELESCHTMEVAGYVVEGHVPEEAVQKLLSEKPDIKGIGMPGMPSGSPGMSGPQKEDFVIYEITHEGDKGEVFMTL